MIQNAEVVSTNPLGMGNPALVISPSEAPFPQQVNISWLTICENRLSIILKRKKLNTYFFQIPILRLFNSIFFSLLK
ncbi:MAG: hypothetical protein LBI53_02980 [Candidatus Peribacteria bacterium]|nr:hypothetical protein [Candidatus Peribacteria bacterium]